MTPRAQVSPGHIAKQREQGWPDIHPEDYCHGCGARNLPWFVDAREVWLEATAEWAAETGREGICCLNCFVQMHHDHTGERVIWSLSKWTPEEGQT